MKDVAGVGKAIDEYQYDLGKKNFQDKLRDLLGEAKEKKSAEPKSDETRHWAVVYTEIEKLLAYAKTYLGV